MGGTVAVTLRTPDGTVHRMARWTNPLPWFVKNAKFFARDPAHVAEWMQKWYQMRTDYERHREDQQFEFPMTSAYAYHTLLAPEGYGLVVLDQRDGFVLDSQGYTGFDYFSLYGHSDTDDLAQAEELMRAGYVESITSLGLRDEKDEKCQFGEVLSAKPGELLDLLKKSGPFQLNLKPQGWQHQRFPETQDGVRKLREAVLARGFELTREEEEAWESYIKHFEV